MLVQAGQHAKIMQRAQEKLPVVEIELCLSDGRSGKWSWPDTSLNFAEDIIKAPPQAQAVQQVSLAKGLLSSSIEGIFPLIVCKNEIELFLFKIRLELNGVSMLQRAEVLFCILFL